MHRKGGAVEYAECNIYNFLEHDHRAIKRRVKGSHGFRSFCLARRTIAGYEAVDLIRKGPSEESRAGARSPSNRAWWHNSRPDRTMGKLSAKPSLETISKLQLPSILRPSSLTLSG